MTRKYKTCENSRKTNWTTSIKPQAALLTLCLLGIFGLSINYFHISHIHTYFRGFQRKTNIVFLKTHKCAGTSIQNILLRFGDMRNLTFVLPPRNNYLGYPTLFNKSHVRDRPLLPEYNILAHHARLNYHEMKSLMPQDTVFVTIIRDPVELFESLFVFFNLKQFYKSDISDVTKWNSSQSTLKRRGYKKFSFNQMMYDLGADSSIFHNDTLVNEYVDKLESWFDLVMVAERMDESLVLLKELMCWDLEDVVTLKQNARKVKFKKNLTNKAKDEIRKLNRADQILYDRFSKKFQRHVDAFGSRRMAKESQRLHRMSNEWFNYCVETRNGKPVIGKRPKRYFKKSLIYYALKKGNSNSTCKTLLRRELAYTDYLREKQGNYRKMTTRGKLSTKKRKAQYVRHRLIPK